MSKLTKKDRIAHLEFQVAWLTDAVHELQGTENPEPQPQLKQLNQSVFNNMHERWRFAAIDADGSAYRYNKEALSYGEGFCYEGDDYNEFKFSLIGKGYDASNWQNSLIERDTAKELLEVDLSSELTGSELCKAMLARGDKYVMCGVSDVSDLDAASNEYDDFMSDAVTDFDNKDGLFGTASMRWIYAVPINNQGEPLTASEAGL